MGQGAVRTAIADALTTAQLPLVGKIFRARGYIDETDYAQNAAGFYTQNTSGSGAVIVVNLPGPDKRMRRALVGRPGIQDTNIHPVVLEVFFANTLGSPEQAQIDYDSIIDELVPYIRNNPTMSAPGTVWSAGEYTAGVVHEQTSPFTQAGGTTVFIVGTVRFEAWEWITGAGS